MKMLSFLTNLWNSNATLVLLVLILIIVAVFVVYYLKKAKEHPKGLIAAALSNMGERFGYYIMNAVLLLFLVSKFGLPDGTAGSYTFGSGWGATATTALARQAFTSSSDLYLIPGTYRVYVSYTLTKGGYSEDFNKSAVVTLQQGKINNITGAASGGDASEIQFSVSITAWSSVTLTPTFE